MKSPVPLKYRPVLKRVADELSVELRQILSWWIHHGKDSSRGGYYGEISVDNLPMRDAPKGSVLHSRILWTLAAAYRQTGIGSYLEEATILFDWVKTRMVDREHGGVYWTCTPAGQPLDTRKQIYAQAFAIYGFAEYYQASGRVEALQLANEIWQTVRSKAIDGEYGGFYEAFTKNWGVIDDNRLSEKEPIVSKTMNTHLHLLEALACLCQAGKDSEIGNDLREMLQLFRRYIIDDSGRFQFLFFERDWKPRHSEISFGHDIESSWLLLHGARCLGAEKEAALYQQLSVSLAEGAIAGLDADGALWNESSPADKPDRKEKDWWVQAEAMVGFYNAWQLTATPVWLDRTVKSWQYIKTYLKDGLHGEWFWGVDQNNQPLIKHYKAGLWKCPYHNGRACLEMLQRISHSGIQ